MFNHSTHKPFLYWLLLAGLIFFGVFISWDLGLLRAIFQQDITRISVIIFTVLIIVSIHCGYRSWFLALQASQLACLKQLQSDEADFPLDYCPKGCSFIQDFIRNSLKNDTESDRALLSEVLAESLRGSHQVGWFMAGVVIKLGLLGTVIGFVLMLSSISGLEQLDISDIKALMQQMTQGMGIAMNTTMIGLMASMLLGIQLLLLDRCADGLLLEAVDFSISVVGVTISNDRGDQSGSLSAQK